MQIFWLFNFWLGLFIDFCPGKGNALASIFGGDTEGYVGDDGNKGKWCIRLACKSLDGVINGKL